MTVFSMKNSSKFEKKKGKKVYRPTLFSGNLTLTQLFVCSWPKIE